MNLNYTDIVTTALYYANGSLHIGHILEAIQADIYVRHLKQNGRKPLFISGSDAHGTPIMLASKAKNIAPKEMTAAYQQEHLITFKKFGIEFDNFHITSSEDNKELTENIYNEINHKGKIFTKEIFQAFDETEQMFLPDRFIKGTCPNCQQTEQYGDSCEACGSFYDPLDMLDAKSIISNSTPVRKKSKHIFFDLNSCKAAIEKFLKNSELEPAVVNKLSEWLDNDLKAWNISRDAPYHGFKIPGYDDKYFYVWMDAPIGYISACKNLDSGFTELWTKHSTTKITHFIGKDIMYFHGLFWPAILNSAGYKQPDKLVVHGFLTINNQKMSKSRGTMLPATDLAEKFNTDSFRYFIASKLNNSVEDLDFNVESFINKHNSDLIGKYLNIASRTANFINKKFNSELLEIDQSHNLYEFVQSQSEAAINYYDKLEFSRAVKTIMQLADRVNQEIAHIQPWQLAKNEAQALECHKFCSIVIYYFITLSILLKPIIPNVIKDVEAFLGLSNLNNSDILNNLKGHKINNYPKILDRISTETTL